VSRSYLAEMIMKHRLKQEGLNHVRVSSRGIYAFSGIPPDQEMIKFLEKQKIPYLEHASRQLSEEDVKWAHIIFVMEKGHKVIIENLWPDSRGKIRSLGSFIKGSHFEDDIPDPTGRSPYHYRLVQAQISMAVDGLMECLKNSQGILNDQDKNHCN
jgi:protein-tyrosine phosphatase